MSTALGDPLDVYADHGTPRFVYEFWDGDVCLYVGCAVRLDRRIASHERDKDWWPRVERIEARRYPDRDAALLAEAERIRELQPIGNSTFTQHYLGVGGWDTRRRRMRERVT